MSSHGNDLGFALKKAIDPVLVAFMEVDCACILISTGCTVHIKNQESTASTLEDVKEHLLHSFGNFLDFVAP